MHKPNDERFRVLAASAPRSVLYLRAWLFAPQWLLATYAQPARRPRSGYMPSSAHRCMITTKGSSVTDMLRARQLNTDRLAPLP
jgi:hypothetical protein